MQPSPPNLSLSLPLFPSHARALSLLGSEMKTMKKVELVFFLKKKVCVGGVLSYVWVLDVRMPADCVNYTTADACKCIYPRKVLSDVSVVADVCRCDP